VAPNALAALPVAAVAATPESSAAIEDDRERFLKELKSQAFASHTQINAAATFRCVLEQNHTAEFEPAPSAHCYGKFAANRPSRSTHGRKKRPRSSRRRMGGHLNPSKTYINAAAACSQCATK
jgi:hypothetical protein